METKITHRTVGTAKMIIAIKGDADRASITERDAIMRQISEQLGRKIMTAKVSRYYLIIEDGKPPLAQRTKFTAALADAFGAAVSCIVPFKN
jgi:hypothetical protein